MSVMHCYLRLRQCHFYYLKKYITFVGYDKPTEVIGL
jgi:hypothetical protein